MEKYKYTEVKKEEEIETGRSVYNIYFLSSEFIDGDELQDSYDTKEEATRGAKRWNAFWENRVDYETKMMDINISPESKRSLDNIRYQLTSEIGLDGDDMAEVKNALKILYEYVLKSYKWQHSK